jgi:6-phosphogluconolactonase
MGAFTVQAGPLIGNVTADDVATDPKGQFLFVGSETAPAIWVFSVNPASGILTVVGGSPFITGFTAGGVADVMTVDASGQFLYAGQLDNTFGVAGFAINSSTGALTPLAGSPFATVQVAQIHASPTAELLFGVQEVADGAPAATDPHIYAYLINSSTGVLTPVAGSPFLTGTGAAPFDFAISPTGTYVYAMEENVTTSTDAPIEGFLVNSGTGALSSMGTFSGVPTSQGCRFDQSGIYLFCVDSLFLGTTLTVNFDNLNNGQLTHGADLTTSPSFPLAVTD